MSEKILLADDVEDLAKATKMLLVHSGYEVDMVFNGKQALDKAKENLYDCIILDIMMPVMDGIEAVKEIRKLNIKTPIILLTAKDLVDDKVEGLDAGANDYLTKPFEIKELLARIRAVTRTQEEQKEEYKIGNVIFNKGNSEISKDTVSLHLNSKECDIMEYLVKNQERNISKEELEQRIWINEASSENVVPMYITYLQEKFSALNADYQINDNDGYILEKLNY